MSSKFFFSFWGWQIRRKEECSPPSYTGVAGKWLFPNYPHYADNNSRMSGLTLASGEVTTKRQDRSFLPVAVIHLLFSCSSVAICSCLQHLACMVTLQNHCLCLFSVYVPLLSLLEPRMRFPHSSPQGNWKLEDTEKDDATAFFFLYTSSSVYSSCRTVPWNDPAFQYYCFFIATFTCTFCGHAS